MWGEKQKRRAVRIEYPCLVTIRKNSPPKLAMLTHTENISVGGVCVQVWEEIAVLTEVELEIDLKDARLPIISKGVIRWVEPIPAGTQEKQLYNTGIQFVALQDKYKQRVQTIIDNYFGKKG